MENDHSIMSKLLKYENLCSTILEHDTRNAYALFLWSLTAIGFKQFRVNHVKLSLYNKVYDFKVAHIGTLKEVMAEKAYIDLPMIGDQFDVIDIGANYGIFGIMLKQQYPEWKGTYVAMEPNQNNYAMLHLNLPVFKTRWILDMAAANRDGKAMFTRSETGITCRIVAKKKEGSYPVSCSKIDTVVNRYKLKPILIKMDVEGGEYDAILGARKTLAKHHPWLIMEVHQNENKVFSLLSKYGYDGKVHKSNNVWMVY